VIRVLLRQEMKNIYLGILLAAGFVSMSVPLGLVYAGDDGSNRRGLLVKSAGAAVLDKEFKIKYGQVLTVKGEGLKVKFDSVPEDSRCPTDVKCVWEGDAKILIGVKRGQAKAFTIELHTNGRFNQTGKYQNYIIKLIAVNPYPKTSAKIKPSDYVATLLVTKE
jgi:hypothetical protein